MLFRSGFARSIGEILCVLLKSHRELTMPALVDREHWFTALRSVPPIIVEEGCDGWDARNRGDVTEEWGFPLVGKTIDMIALLRRLREFLLHYAPLLRVLKEDGEEGPLGVQYLRAKIAKTEADAHGKIVLNAMKEGRLCDRETVHSIFELIASRITRAADVAQKKWGADGFEFFDDLAKGLEDDYRGLIDQRNKSTDEVGADSDDSGDDVG